MNEGTREAQRTTPVEEQVDFPVAGARARQWRRFERELSAWLASPAGRFATWRAQQTLAGTHSPRRAR